MGFRSARTLCHRIRHLIAFLLCLLITWNYVKLIAEGRAIPKLKNEGTEVESNKKGQEKAVRMRLLIGSWPPRCERRCRSCGHCEAVQVPIVPVVERSKKQSRTTSSSLSRGGSGEFFANSRGADISNYKPMCWKCKCGDLIFNP